MKSKIQLWGNSLALRIPKFIANEMKISNGSNVDISLDDEKIIVRSLKEIDYSLESFLEEINNNNIHEEKDFGEPVGGEIW